MTARDSLVATPRTCTKAHRCKSRGPLCVLKLALMLTTLASTPGLAEEALETAFGPQPTVSMDHSTFTPGEITVTPGTTVTWVNKESMPHTVVDLNRGFRSKILAKDGTFSFTFTNAGDYNYLCSIHPNMKGKVIVKPSAG
jgi:plastocyanin